MSKLSKKNIQIQIQIQILRGTRLKRKPILLWVTPVQLYIISISLTVYYTV